MTNASNQPRRDDDESAVPTPVRGDRLDALLSEWHDTNKQRARAMRDSTMAQVGTSKPERSVLARIGFVRMLSAAAVLAFSVVLVLLFFQNTEKSAFAEGGLVQVADGGALDAIDGDGNTLGPCPL